jgi:hypothetical protein
MFSFLISLTVIYCTKDCCDIVHILFKENGIEEKKKEWVHDFWKIQDKTCSFRKLGMFIRKLLWFEMLRFWYQNLLYFFVRKKDSICLDFDIKKSVLTEKNREWKLLDNNNLSSTKAKSNILVHNRLWNPFSVITASNFEKIWTLFFNLHINSLKISYYIFKSLKLGTIEGWILTARIWRV